MEGVQFNNFSKHSYVASLLRSLKDLSSHENDAWDDSLPSESAFFLLSPVTPSRSLHQACVRLAGCVPQGSKGQC